MTEPQSKGWWGRNWKWFLPVGCLGLIVIALGGITLVLGIMKSSDVYKESVARA